MWTNSLLKKNAWNSLKNYYWVALGVSLLAGIMGASSNGFSTSFNLDSSELEDLSSNMDSEEFIMMIVLILGVALFSFVFTVLFVTFVGGPAACGQCKFFCDARNGDVRFNKLFSNFGSGKYIATVKTMFFKSLYIFLWSLLFVIPGIVKSYEYYLIPYLLAENPNLSKERAFEISMQTMKGEKWKLFVLQLSFIGWYLLGYLACCFGIIFVLPYFNATMAEFYMCMRAKMISYGYTTDDELTGTVTIVQGGFSQY